MKNKKNKQIRTRFAPSPTGEIHIGNLRTALFAWLFARNQQGNFIVRLEDTDRKRLNYDAIKQILQALDWVNLDIDEGISLNEKGELFQTGDYGPYIQSERLAVYQKYIQILLEEGYAYYCFCSEDRLSKIRQWQQQEKKLIMYDQHCRNLSEAEVRKKIKQGEPYVIRMKVPQDRVVEFEDKVFGKVSVKSEIIDDQVLIKADGFPTYHFAVVVDDHLMKISHIFRGEDWIPSTPKHLLLYEFFGWEPPIFIHLPNVLGKDKKKLSKRTGAVSVADFKAQGYLPEALINFLALLGWNPKTEQEIFSLQALIDKFEIEGLNKGGAVFNYQKLNWFNREYLQQLSDSDFSDKVKEFLPAKLKDLVKAHQEIFQKILPLLRERIEVFQDVAVMAEAGELTYYFVQPNYPKEALLWKNETDLTKTKQHLEQIIALLEKVGNFDEINIKQAVWDYATEQGRGDVLWPMRYALSGQEKSPDPFVLAQILGRKETIQRLQYAIEKLN